MMDKERSGKNLQEVVETTQLSFQAAIENTFALQERTLEFAKSLLEASGEALQAQAEDNRATIETLAEQSKRQREAMENLVQESVNVYTNLLAAPFSHGGEHPKFEEATKAPEVSSEGSR